MRLTSIMLRDTVQVGLGQWRSSVQSPAYEIELFEQSGVVRVREAESGIEIVLSPGQWRSGRVAPKAAK